MVARYVTKLGTNDAHIIHYIGEFQATLISTITRVFPPPTTTHHPPMGYQWKPSQPASQASQQDAHMLPRTERDNDTLRSYSDSEIPDLLA